MSCSAFGLEVVHIVHTLLMCAAQDILSEVPRGALSSVRSALMQDCVIIAAGICPACSQLKP